MCKLEDWVQNYGKYVIAAVPDAIFFGDAMILCRCDGCLLCRIT